MDPCLSPFDITSHVTYYQMNIQQASLPLSDVRLQFTIKDRVRLATVRTRTLFLLT